jgi:hypothetical protein
MFASGTPGKQPCPGNKSRLGKTVNVARIFIFLMALNMLSSLVTGADSPGVTGSWNIDITFANEQHRFLRFDAQADGKGTFTVTDPRSKVWANTKPSEAKWSTGEANSFTFSGPVEFLIGNVGRDVGILTCKGNFKNPDFITGEADFSPSVGDRPSKHGTFKAIRAAKQT